MTGTCATLAAGAAVALLKGRWWPRALWPEEQRWPSDTRVRWAGRPYVERGPNGERLEVRAGDEGVVVTDHSPISFCVSFLEDELTFCTSRSSVRLIDLAAEEWRLRA